MRNVPQILLSPALWRAVWGRRSLPLFLARSAARYGDLIQLRPRVWLASHPSLAQQVLSENATKWSKARGVEKTGRLLGDGILGSHGDKHRARRRLLQPLFAAARLPFYRGAIIESALETRARWREGQVVDMHAEMSALALSIVARTVFGSDMEMLLRAQTERVAASLDEAMRLFNGSMTPVGDLYERLPPVQKRFQFTRAALDGVIFELMAAKRRALSSGAAPGQDALSVLLAARDEKGAALPDEDIRDEAMTLLLAGHETTANALCFAWWFLGHHPAARARLDAELDAEISGEILADEPFDPARFPQTRAILSETMRLLPPAWVVARCALEDIELRTAEVRTASPRTSASRVAVPRVTVPRGTTVFVSPFVMGRDARFWHDARRFNPTRWTRDFVPENWSYLPFGAGHRACLAENFAWMEAILCLATLARRFTARPLEALRLEPSVTLRPRGALWMRLTCRER